MQPVPTKVYSVCFPAVPWQNVCPILATRSQDGQRQSGSFVFIFIQIAFGHAVRYPNPQVQQAIL
jgi:hypothetical protein